MADSTPTPNSTPTPSPRVGMRVSPNRRSTTGLPPWATVFVIIAVILVLVFVILHLTGNGFGDHMHMSNITHGVHPL
jgi:uncharacterized membrane protein